MGKVGRTIIGFLLIVLGGFACAEKPNEAQLTSTIPEVETVLDGTDLIEISTIDLRPLDGGSIEGKYKAEQGGSELMLTVTQKGDQWTVDRTYSEPELAVAAKTYQAKTQDGMLVSTGDDLFVKGTSEGLLVLELQSEVDSIPASYWTHYLRQ